MSNIVKKYHSCSQCGFDLVENRKKCSKCLVVYYCSEECQRAHWKLHKNFCVEDSELVAVRNVFLDWSTNFKTVFERFTPLYKQYKTTAMAIHSKKLFLKIVDDTPLTTVMVDGPDYLRANVFLRKACFKNLVFVVFYYKVINDETRALMNHCKERIGAREPDINTDPFHHVILTVANTNLLVDALVK